MIYDARMRRALLAALVLLVADPALAFDLQGHSGARGLAPENTLAAFARALAIGVTTLELDLAMTRDDVLVISHDRRLNPDHTRGAHGAFLAREGPPIRTLTLAELQRYDVGRLKPGSDYAAAFPAQQPADGPLHAAKQSISAADQPTRTASPCPNERQASPEVGRSTGTVPDAVSTSTWTTSPV